MVDVVGLAATAKRLVEENGRSVTFLKSDRDARDPDKPWRGSVTTSQPGKPGLGAQAIAVFVPASGSGFGSSVVTGEAGRRSADQVAIVASDSLATTVELEEYDLVRDGDRVWGIVFVEELRPGGTSVVYGVGVAR